MEEGRACLRRITTGASDCVILRNGLDIEICTFGEFSLPCILRGLNAIANGDREDYKGGDTGESLFLLADRLAEVDVSCGSEHLGSDSTSLPLYARETLTQIMLSSTGSSPSPGKIGHGNIQR